MAEFQRFCSRCSISWVLVGVLCAPMALVAAEQDLEQVVAKHIEARGGFAAWDAVESIQIQGDYTAFSEVHPFTLSRQRNGIEANYRMDGYLGSKRRIVGWDGEQAWWCDEWTGQIDWPAKISGVSKAVLHQDAEMATPFFNWQARGFEVQLLGHEDVEGTDTLKLELTRPSGEQEIWFLDAETYLEVARDATADEFGRAVQGRMFFDDFRKIPGPKGDLVIPHYTEVEWAIRHRVMEIAEVQINPELDAEIFEMPPPPGMETLLGMVGRWKVDVEERTDPQEPFKSSQRESEIVADFGNTLIRERTAFPGGRLAETLWTFDRYQNTYRAVQINTEAPRLNVLEGSMGDGRLTVSNLETRTSYSMFGMTVHDRISVFGITENGFQLEWEISTDGGDAWVVVQKLAYSKIY